VIFLSRGGGGSWNGSDGLESFTVKVLTEHCDPRRFGQAAARWRTISLRGVRVATPSCYFGRPGMYAAYSFVFVMGGVDRVAEPCLSEANLIQDDGEFGQLQCSALNSLSPSFVFMSKSLEEREIQDWTYFVYDRLYVM
jgi:hypothetical protein